MKIAIIGAGALGLVYGGLLSKHNDVHFFCSSEANANIINEKGVIINDVEKETSEVYYPKAHLNGTYNEKMDCVFLLVKTNYSESALESNIGLIQKDTYIVTLQNGLGNDMKIMPYTDKNHLILGVTRINSKRVGPSEADRMNHGMAVLGYNESSYPFVKRLEETLKKCGLDASSTDKITHLIWDKLLLNLCCNPYCAYYECAMGELVEDENKWKHIEKTLSEAVEVALAEGESFEIREVIAADKEFCKKVNGYPSMYQDIIAGRITEIESMNGRIVTLGKKHHIATPENEWITSEIHHKEKNLIKR